MGAAVETGILRIDLSRNRKIGLKRLAPLDPDEHAAPSRSQDNCNARIHGLQQTQRLEQRAFRAARIPTYLRHTDNRITHRAYVPHILSLVHVRES